MKKLYLIIWALAIYPQISKSQDCSLLNATYVTYESRCTATGSVKIMASGGSGSYKYKLTGPVNTNFTSTDSITGIGAGTYTLLINDIVTNCTRSITNVVVAGTYVDPRFTLLKTDVTCDNSLNGSITVNNQLNGRDPFTYTIVAPSAMGIGTTNNTGVFTDLGAGDFTIRLTDSCGGIQTRQITIANYTWWIDSRSFIKTSCDIASGFIVVKDSKGNISTVGGIPDFTYGIVRTPGDTIWSSNPTFVSALLGDATFVVIAKDACGIIKKASASVNLMPSVGSTVNVYNKQCNTFSASLTNLSNFFTGDYCLYNSSNVLVACNTSGVFTGISYGSYCIRAHDICTDTLISRCFTATPPVISISNTIRITNKICTSFTASVTGQSGLTNPQYCLYNSSDVLISCNTTGVFDDIAYDAYCIKTTDGCRDTTITKCFRPFKPVPSVISVIVPSYITCTNFGIVVTGDSLTTPQFCLYDSNAVLISCNTTGIFDSIPLGNFCVNVYDPCYDTTIIRCSSVGLPSVTNDIVNNITNKACDDFTVTATSINLLNPQYCLYTSGGILVSCNLTGVFNNVQYGSYCMNATTSCPDTTMITCFTVTQPEPAVDGTIRTSAASCSTFNASVIGEVNISDANFCIYDYRDILVSCNSTGDFSGLPYGSYCIKITERCYDTTIIRCFTMNPTLFSLSGTAAPSCNVGFAKFDLSIGNGNMPVNIKIYAPDSSIVSDASYNTSTINIDNIPPLSGGRFYKILATDACGSADSLTLGVLASYFNHSPVVRAKCPGSGWNNGSGDIVTTVSTNLGSLTVTIIKKNGIAYAPALSPNIISAGSYSFYDLGPGTYIVRAVENSCNNGFYDTVVINTYQFPNLSRSSAYQCDVNGFSVSANATNGVSPFLYEIIGSLPSTPSIVSAPQASSIFNIDNGSNYSLIRLRALDACGNATLGDASILPLAINGIVNTFNCFFMPATLTVDSMYNSTYTWYKKTNATSTDSVLMGSGPSLFIPEVSPSDTGVYVCVLSVNNGCITRTYNYNLDGSCFDVLPVQLGEFKGRTAGNKNYLNWNLVQQDGLDNFIIERNNGNNVFTEIGRVGARAASTGTKEYSFTDHSPVAGKNYYRLRMMDFDNSFKLSNIILLNNDKPVIGVNIYPNPASDKLNIDFGINRHHYKISLYSIVNTLVKELSVNTTMNNNIEVPVGKFAKGMYIIKIFNVDTNETFSQKIILQ